MGGQTVEFILLQPVNVVMFQSFHRGCDGGACAEVPVRRGNAFSATNCFSPPLRFAQQLAVARIDGIDGSHAKTLSTVIIIKL